jgi:hypothetical protein
MPDGHLIGQSRLSVVRLHSPDDRPAGHTAGPALGAGPDVGRGIHALIGVRGGRPRPGSEPEGPEPPLPGEKRARVGMSQLIGGPMSRSRASGEADP